MGDYNPLKNEPIRDESASKLVNGITISVAEYERFLRDKTQLDLVLQMYLNKEYSFQVDNLLKLICAMRGLTA